MLLKGAVSSDSQASTLILMILDFSQFFSIYLNKDIITTIEK